MKRFLVLLMWGVTACGRLSVDDGQGAVTGQLLGRDGAPVVNARVMLIQARRPVAEVRSGVDGRFTLTGPSGPSALFALVNDTSDEGVYRGDLELLPTGTTDVGELRATVVWAFPDALWLRDTGFDEQLTRRGNHHYLAGGVFGEPLVTGRWGIDTLSLWRIEDDGTEVSLLEVPAVDPLSVSPAPNEPPPPVVFVQGSRDAAGQLRVMVINGGFSWVSASGTLTSPVSRVRWLDPRSGVVVHDVVLSPDEGLQLLPFGGLITSPAGSRVVSADGEVVTSERVVGRAVEVGPRRLAGYECDAARQCTFFRVEADGQVSRAAPFALPTNLSTGEFHDGAVLGLIARDFNLGLVTFFRFDVDSLLVTAETAEVGPRAENLHPCAGVGAMGWIEPFAGETRLVTVRSHLTTRTLSVPWEPSRGRQCMLGDELWREVWRPDGTRVLFQTRGPLVRLQQVWWRSSSFIGTRPLLERADDPLRRQWIGAVDGSIDGATPAGRLSATFPLSTDDPNVVISQGAPIEGKRSLFRVRLPEAR